MGKSYGMMMGYSDAISWIEEHAPEADGKSQVLNRMRYERDKTLPVRPKFRKGVYGKKHDSWSCGNCGRGGIDVIDDYCPKCGFKIGWESTKCLTK